MIGIAAGQVWTNADGGCLIVFSVANGAALVRTLNIARPHGGSYSWMDPNEIAALIRETGMMLAETRRTNEGDTP